MFANCVSGGEDRAWSATSTGDVSLLRRKSVGGGYRDQVVVLFLTTLFQGQTQVFLFFLWSSSRLVLLNTKTENEQMKKTEREQMKNWKCYLLIYLFVFGLVLSMNVEVFADFTLWFLIWLKPPPSRGGHIG